MIPQYKQLIKRKYIKAVYNQLKTGLIGTGDKTAEFGTKIREIGNHRFSVVTTSSSAAFILALLSLRLPHNSTILFPAYTFLAGANAARFLGFNVRLVDVDEGTLCMDPEQIKVTRDVSAIIFVDHNGYVGSVVSQVAKICQDTRIKMIEDASQAIGMHRAGRNGDAAVYSFSLNNLISTGQGGILVTDSYETSELARRIKLNLNFNDILASYGLAQLNDINDLLRRRKRVFDTYRKHLPIVDFGIDSTAMVAYKTQRQTAKHIISILAENNIEGASSYSPVTMNPIYASGKVYPVAETLYKHLVYLPSSLTLTGKDIKKICSVVLKADEI